MRLLLRRRIDLVVVLRLTPELLRQDVRHRRRQRRLPMVNVSNRPHVHVRLRSLKFAFGHDGVLGVLCVAVCALLRFTALPSAAASPGAHDAD